MCRNEIVIKNQEGGVIQFSSKAVKTNKPICYDSCCVGLTEWKVGK